MAGCCVDSGGRRGDSSHIESIHVPQNYERDKIIKESQSLVGQKLTLEEPVVAVQPAPRTLPRAIWALGLGAMFMDMSSELVHSLLPIFMVSVLGASMITIGFLEGVAEATAAITKIFSGALSDYLGKRKFLVVLGYGLGAITKPVFPMAPSAFGSSPRALRIAWERAYAARRATLWSQTVYKSTCDLTVVE